MESDRPVSRQHELELHGYYGWPLYWGGGMVTAGTLGVYPELVVQPELHKEETPARGEEAVGQAQDDPHLRSAREVTGYHIQAVDGGIGHVQDFIVDDEDWGIRYMLVDTRNWLPGESVLVSPQRSPPGRGQRRGPAQHADGQHPAGTYSRTRRLLSGAVYKTPGFV